MSTAQAMKADTSFSPRTGGGSVTGPVSLVFGNDYSGYRAYYFLRIDSRRLPLFRKAVKAGKSFNLEHYGEILARGYGEVPPQVLERMRRDYGWSG